MPDGLPPAAGQPARAQAPGRPARTVGVRIVCRRVRSRFPQATARRVFPGDVAEVRRLRRWLRELLPDVPARDDVIIVAVELAANAVRHTASGCGGVFTVEITWRAAPCTVRIAVADGGAPARPQAAAAPGPLSEHGRGLQVVRALAARSGAHGDHRGGLTWADVPWTGGDPAGAGFPAGYEAAFRGGQPALAAGQPGVVAWLGCAVRSGEYLAGRRHRAVFPAATADSSS